MLAHAAPIVPSGGGRRVALPSAHAPVSRRLLLIRRLILRSPLNSVVCRGHELPNPADTRAGRRRCQAAWSLERDIRHAAAAGYRGPPRQVSALGAGRSMPSLGWTAWQAPDARTTWTRRGRGERSSNASADASRSTATSTWIGQSPGQSPGAQHVISTVRGQPGTRHRARMLRA